MVVDLTGLGVLATAVVGGGYSLWAASKGRAVSLTDLISVSAAAGMLPCIGYLFAAALTNDLAMMGDGWRGPLSIAAIVFVVNALDTIVKPFRRPPP